MVGAKSLVILLLALLSAGTWSSAFAQGSGMSLQAGKSYLGLSVGRSRFDTDCGTTTLVCDRTERSARLSLGTMLAPNWGLEASYVDLGRMARLGGQTKAQGLDFSLVGKARLGPSFGVFGKVGTTYGRTDTSVMGGPAAAVAASGVETGFGLSYGGGVSYDITERLSATLEIDSHDMRFAGGQRDPVRSTNLGLQWKY